MSASLSSIFKPLKPLCLVLLIAMVSCKTGRPQRELLVAAASDLTKALEELGGDFERRTGTRVVPTFGASGILAQQISHGAPFDIFLSADRRYVDQLAKEGRVRPGSRRVYARGRLVVWSATSQVRGLDDLAGPQFRHIAIANPAYAPYGRAARQALERSGLWDRLQPKIVIAQTIRHALEMAESHNAEATITALSLSPGSAGVPPALVPENLHDPIDQEAAIIKFSPEAREFFEYLGTEDARMILSKYGFAFPK